MRRPSLRSQLNQIRLWVRQGRTDAWIAHKLDVSLDQLGQFKREQGLNGEPGPREEAAGAGLDVAPEGRDEIVEPPPEAPREALEAELDVPPLEPEPDLETTAAEADQAEPAEPEPAEPEPARRRRRGRRGGRRRGARRQSSYEGTFDHGAEGYGLWLDPAVAEDEVYAEHWAGHRAVAVTVEPDAITIRRAETPAGRDSDED